MTPANTILTTRIAMATASAELFNARMLGHSWDDAYASSLKALDEVRAFAAADMPADAVTRFGFVIGQSI